VLEILERIGQTRWRLRPVFFSTEEMFAVNRHEHGRFLGQEDPWRLTLQACDAPLLSLGDSMLTREAVRMARRYCGRTPQLAT